MSVEKYLQKYIYSHVLFIPSHMSTGNWADQAYQYLDYKESSTCWQIGSQMRSLPPFILQFEGSPGIIVHFDQS